LPFYGIQRSNQAIRGAGYKAEKPNFDGGGNYAGINITRPNRKYKVWDITVIIPTHNIVDRSIMYNGLRAVATPLNPSGTSYPVVLFAFLKIGMGS
jgi:hypothetical protein